MMVGPVHHWGDGQSMPSLRIRFSNENYIFSTYLIHVDLPTFSAISFYWCYIQCYKNFT